MYAVSIDLIITIVIRTLYAAYSYYNVANTVSLKQLMSDALVLVSMSSGAQVVEDMTVCLYSG